MRSKKVAAVLAFFLGGIGVHKFYLGETGKGLLYLLFCWTLVPAILAFISFCRFAFGSQESFDAKYNKGIVSTVPVA
jgi:TM2 domain-containing membrane protein YozV